jgi:PASTA domain
MPLRRELSIAIAVLAIAVLVLAIAIFRKVDSGHNSQGNTPSTLGSLSGHNVTVPNVVGESISQAATRLHSLGFRVNIVNAGSVETVARQLPTPGKREVAGSQVSIFTTN